MGYISASTFGIGPTTGGANTDRHPMQKLRRANIECYSHRDSGVNSPANPVCVFVRAGFTFVFQAATVEAALRSFSTSTRVVGESTAATRPAVFPCWEGKK